MSKRAYCNDPTSTTTLEDESDISQSVTKVVKIEHVQKQSFDKCIQVDEDFNDDESIVLEVTNLLVTQVCELADRFQLAPNRHNDGDEVDGGRRHRSSAAGVSPSSTSSTSSSCSSSSSTIRRGCLKNRSANKKRRVIFNAVTVHYFERSQGFTCVPSAGGSTLGMEEKHHSSKTFTLETHAEERKRAHREIYIRRRKFEKAQKESASDTESESDNASDFSDIDLENDSVYFLQPVSVKERRALLRASGVTKIDPTEKEECSEIRLSREFCGCDCENYCNPKTCACSLAGIQCQVDRLSFPCGCTKDHCKNVNGRVEFNPMRVRSHFLNTILRVQIENKDVNCHQNKLGGESVTLIDGVQRNNDNVTQQLNYHMVHTTHNHQQSLQYMSGAQHSQQQQQQHQLTSHYGPESGGVVDAAVVGYGATNNMFATGYSPSTSTYSDDSEYTNGSSEFDNEANVQVNGKNHCATTTTTATASMAIPSGMFHHQNGGYNHVAAASLPPFPSINGHSYQQPVQAQQQQQQQQQQHQFYGQYNNGHQHQQPQDPSVLYPSYNMTNHYGFQQTTATTGGGEFQKCDNYSTMTHTHESVGHVNNVQQLIPQQQQQQQQYTELGVPNLATVANGRHHTKSSHISTEPRELCYPESNSVVCNTAQHHSFEYGQPHPNTDTSVSAVYANESYVPNVNNYSQTAHSASLSSPSSSTSASTTATSTSSQPEMNGIVESVSA